MILKLFLSFYFRTVQIWPYWQFLLRSCSFICTATCASNMWKFDYSHHLPFHVGAWP